MLPSHSRAIQATTLHAPQYHKTAFCEPPSNKISTEKDSFKKFTWTHSSHMKARSTLRGTPDRNHNIWYYKGAGDTLIEFIHVHKQGGECSRTQGATVVGCSRSRRCLCDTETFHYIYKNQTIDAILPFLQYFRPKIPCVSKYRRMLALFQMNSTVLNMSPMNTRYEACYGSFWHHCPPWLGLACLYN